MNHEALLQEIIAKEIGTPWAEFEETLKAITSDQEMNRRMREEWAKIPQLTQEEICKYYATSKTWLAQTYNQGRSGLLALARKDVPFLPAWGQEFLRHLPARSTVLDFGGGFLKDSWFFVPRGHRVVLGEVEGPVTRIVLAYLEAADIRGVSVLPIRDETPTLGKYHGIVCFETLEHVKNPVALTQRLVASLVPGGPFVMSVSFGAPEHAPYHLAENAHLSQYDNWADELKKMGLVPVWSDVSSIRLWRKGPL